MFNFLVCLMLNAYYWHRCGITGMSETRRERENVNVRPYIYIDFEIIYYFAFWYPNRKSTSWYSPIGVKYCRMYLCWAANVRGNTWYDPYMYSVQLEFDASFTVLSSIGGIWVKRIIFLVIHNACINQHKCAAQVS